MSIRRIEVSEREEIRWPEYEKLSHLYRALGVLVFFDERIVRNIAFSILSSYFIAIKDIETYTVSLGFLLGERFENKKEISSEDELYRTLSNLTSIELLLNMINKLLRIQRERLTEMLQRMRGIDIKQYEYLLVDLITSLYTGYYLPSFVSGDSKYRYDTFLTHRIIDYDRIYIFAGKLDLVKPGGTIKDVFIINLPEGNFVLGNLHDSKHFFDIANNAVGNILESELGLLPKFDRVNEHSYYIRVIIPQNAMKKLTKDDIPVVIVGTTMRYEEYVPISKEALTTFRLTRAERRQTKVYKEPITDIYLRVVALFDATSTTSRIKPIDDETFISNIRELFHLY